MFIKKILTFLLILTFSKIVVAYPISDIEKQNIQNTLNLLKEKYNTSEDNYVISGTSVYFAADMLANGASNKSLEELSTILGNYSVENINQELSRKLKTSGRTLELSNSIWGNDFNEDYKKTLSQWLNADVNPLPGNTSTIDEWVKEKTHGKITALFGNKPTSSLDLYLVNTVYFKDRWRDEFEKEKTKDGIFHNLNSGDTIVPMMHATENYACMETDFFYSIKLPYRNGGTMYIFLPKETVDFRDFINNFEISHFIDKKYTWQKVHLQLPKFKLEDKTDLKKIFQSLGINEIFNNENQDFTKMTSIGAYVKEMLQKTIIEVDEEGTTAAAATGGMVVEQGIEEISDFIIDRPFLFFVDKGNFMGIITKFEKVDSIDYTQFNTNRVTNLNGTSKRRRRR